MRARQPTRGRPGEGAAGRVFDVLAAWPLRGTVVGTMAFTLNRTFKSLRMTEGENPKPNLTLLQDDEAISQARAPGRPIKLHAPMRSVVRQGATCSV